MPNCAACGNIILFGGRRLNERRYCNDKCASSEAVHAAAEDIPLEIVRRTTLDVFDGSCPACRGPGPVDVRHWHMALSYFIGCSWWSNSQVSCFDCGRRQQIKSAIITGLIGWISVPGLVVAPIQVFRNVNGAWRRRPSEIPSEELERRVRYDLRQQNENDWAKQSFSES